jgi:hypothetical protein
MATLAEKIVKLLKHTPGLTDREITDQLNGHSAPQQSINQKCRGLEDRGVLERRKRSDGLIGNYLTSQAGYILNSNKEVPVPKSANENLSEDEVKSLLERWLVSEGWQVEISWGHSQGADIVAHKGNKRWIIEVKGCGSLQPMRVNYFLGVLGEVLQRMDNPDAEYSVAFPDMQQFRGLWERLPSLAKSMTGISALFVGANGNVIRL